jgi:hypothetical protein
MSFLWSNLFLYRTTGSLLASGSGRPPARSSGARSGLVVEHHRAALPRWKIRITQRRDPGHWGVRIFSPIAATQVFMAASLAR